jgi:hypothetical protein
LDEESGILFWRWRTDLRHWRSWNKQYCGKPAGTRTRPDGYVLVSIDGKRFRAHRVIFALATGALPSVDDEVDHVDDNPANNRPSNLRLATHSQNAFNTKRRTTNRSGFKGVSPNWKGFAAQIMIEGELKHLGTFATPQEAHAVYVRAARELHGEFARSA